MSISVAAKEVRARERSLRVSIGMWPPGVSEVWQAKDLERGIFGSVAMGGLTGEFSEVWQGRDLKNERYGSNKVRM